MRQTEYLNEVLAYYKENDIVQGDPNEGKWEDAHTPWPQGMGDNEVPLLRYNHVIHDLWQSIELGEMHYVPKQAQDALYHGPFCDGWFLLCDEQERLTVESSSRIGKRMATEKRGVCGRSKEEMVEQGRRNARNGVGMFAASKEERVERSSKAGKTAARLGVGIHAMSKKELQANGVKAGTASAASPNHAHKQLWQSLIDPTLIGMAAVIVRQHKAQGWDPNARVYIGQKPQ